MMKTSLGGLLLAALCLFSTVVPGPALAAATGDAGIADLESRVAEFRLPNGLLFIVLERHFAPVFSFATQVDAGGVDSPAGRTGIAHMMEHMAFKGTPMVGTTDPLKEAEALEKVDRAWARVLEQKKLALFGRGDSSGMGQALREFHLAQEEAQAFVISSASDRLLEENGAQNLNAGTGVDQTTYYYSLPSNKLELWAASEGSRLTYPVFREFYKERDVVIEERRIGTESSPRGRLRDEVLNTAFEAHPYHNGIIGYRSDLESLSRSDAEQFFRKYYVAANMVVAIVGDVKLGEVRRLAEKYFSDIPPGPKPDPVLTVEPPQRAEKTVRTREEAQPVCLVAYSGAPSFTDPAYLAVEALTDVLAGGRSSRLYTRLVKEKKLAVSIGCTSGYPGVKYPNLIWCSVLPAPGVSPDTLAVELQREFDRLKDHPVTATELAAYRNRARSDFIGGLHGNRELASQLAYFQTRAGNWHELFRYPDRIQRLTPEEVTAQGLSILVPWHRTIGILENAAQKTGGKP